MGVDPWLHIFIIKFISKNNSLPLEFYHDNLGLHIIGVIIHFFSNIDFLLIPDLFLFYTFPVSAMILYGIFKKIFNSENLAIFGTFFIEFSFIGFSFMMYQYWPTSLAVIQSLMIFYLLYSRQTNFIKFKRPSKKSLLKNLSSTYIMVIFLFISSLLIHSLITILMIISYIWIYLIYFIKEYRRGFDLLLLIFLMGIFSMFLLFDFSIGHFTFLLYLNTITLNYILIGIIGGVLILAIIIFLVVRSINFKQGKFKSVILNKNYTKSEKRKIVPILIFIVGSVSIIFFFGNIFLFHLNISTIFTVIQIVIIFFIGIFGYNLYQKKPKGKYLFIWLVGYLVILGIGFFSYSIFGIFREYPRIFLLSTVPILIGFISYIYKLIKAGQIKKPIVKSFIVIFIVFSVFSTFIEEDPYFKSFSLEKRELSNLNWYVNYTNNSNVLILEFGWEYPLIYNMYPYNESTVYPFDMFEYIFIEEKYLNPNIHENYLRELKNYYQSDLYLILTDYYTSISGWENFGRLSENDTRFYYNISYLNRICSTKTTTDYDEPLYWFI
ncbi:MAG: hypothetical protein EU549_05235 [Promethearchaeota archaeon]|nr:MAG: hypothetical protein EU549_05235 [Candidatus Lokiarchaeota archaeon]